jgi:branched-chain amino acid transport system ATP-binding protein
VTELRLHRLSRRFGGLTALHELDLDLAAGARHALIGPNGAGKTTLLHLITGTLRPTTGAIIHNGQPINGLSAAARARRGIARTWQHPAIFHRLSVVDNLSLAIHTRRQRARVEQLLHEAGLAEHATAPAGRLPYGLQRRLELAMALAARPRLLLLDEPSAGLDPDQLTHLTHQLRTLPDHVTVLLVDHHLDLVWSLADRITVLHHGRHLTTGQPKAIRANPQVRDAYLATSPIPSAARPNGRPGAPLLRVRALSAGYHGTPVITGIDLEVHEGEAVAVLGRNGAGKTTLLNAIAGLHPPGPGSRIELAGRSLAGQPPHRLAQAGIALVPQGRRLFGALTVTEHLTAATGGRKAAGRQWPLDRILTLLPALADRTHHRANRLSGGEQQMLALARALAAGPRLLILDEPGEGLAPTVLTHLVDALAVLVGEGLALLIAEPNPTLAGAIAHRAIVLHSGRAAMTCSVLELGEPARRQHLDTLLGVRAEATPPIPHP